VAAYTQTQKLWSIQCTFISSLEVSWRKKGGRKWLLLYFSDGYICVKSNQLFKINILLLYLHIYMLIIVWPDFTSVNFFGHHSIGAFTLFLFLMFFQGSVFFLLLTLLWHDCLFCFVCAVEPLVYRYPKPPTKT